MYERSTYLSLSQKLMDMQAPVKATHVDVVKERDGAGGLVRVYDSPRSHARLLQPHGLRACIIPTLTITPSPQSIGKSRNTRNREHLGEKSTRNLEQEKAETSMEAIEEIHLCSNEICRLCHSMPHSSVPLSAVIELLLMGQNVESRLSTSMLDAHKNIAIGSIVSPSVPAAVRQFDLALHSL
jgi:hypothetical protein